MSDIGLATFAAEYDRELLKPLLRQAEAERQKILTLFPREKLGELTLAQYAPGVEVTEPVLAALIVSKSTALGGDIPGTAFNPVGIHRLKGSAEYRSNLENSEGAEKDWLRLRAALEECCKLAEKGDWETIDRVPISNWIPALRTKLLYVYFPDEVLPVFISGEMSHFLSALEVGFSIGKGKWAATPNRKLLEHLRAIPELKGLNPLEMSIILKAWRPRPKPSAGETILRIAPGEQAAYWEECLENGYICVGWDEIGDMLEFKTEEELRASFEEAYRKDPDTSGKQGSRTRQAGMLWRLRNLKPGNRIVANRGLGEILAVGTVNEKAYRWDHTRGEFNHTVHVDWDTGFAKKLATNQSDWRVTITTLTEAQKEMVFQNPSTSARENQRMEISGEAPFKASLNHILYGPPGTGKTYSVIRNAAMIIGQQPMRDGLEAKAAFDKACSAGRIRLTTFHQSFGYEDFIEGIRPVMDEGEDAKFQIRDGIFKEIAIEALFACLERTELTGIFESHWGELLRKISEAGTLSIPGLALATWNLTETTQGNVEAVNAITAKRFYCGRTALAAVWGKLYPASEISSTESAAAFGKPAHHHVVAAVYNFMRNLKPPAADNGAGITPSDRPAIVQSFLELGETSGWRLREDGKFPPYVLVVDEINRGNISRIFGELISLIEDDKRHGADNALRVTLPVSREIFAVPPNLFVLGTMNTADKSLALLDIALRRRFEFQELAPDFNYCKNLHVDMRLVLSTMNERIELRKDRDHRIGHAFFMDVNDSASFNRAFTRKVIPLLQEYFFNDVDGARFVLGEIGREKQLGFLRQITTTQADSTWQRNRWRWFTDEDPNFDCQARLLETLGTPTLLL